MARNVQCLVRITSNLFKSLNTQRICLNGSRTLYNESALGLDGYKKTRDNVNQQFLNMSDKFREKMQSYLSAGSKNMVFTEDLKNMLHLVNNNPADLELLLKMMVKFNSQNKELRFGSFIFGPVVMRTYYYLDQVDEALAAFYNPELQGFFDQVMSYQILMDLLYNHQRWADLRRVFETIIVSQPLYQTSKYPRHIITLVLGGCYKENTPESLNFAMDLWQKLKEKGHMPMRRASTFFAGLALNQGKPDIATEVIFNVQRTNYITVLNLKVAGLADLDRLDDILPILRMSLSSDNANQKKHLYTKEAINKIEQAIERAGLTEADAVVRMVAQIKQNGHISENSLDELITMEIVGIPNEQRQRQNSSFPGNRNEYQPRNRQNDRPYRSFNNYQQRPGLKELV